MRRSYLFYSEFDDLPNDERRILRCGNILNSFKARVGVRWCRAPERVGLRAGLTGHKPITVGQNAGADQGRRIWCAVALFVGLQTTPCALPAPANTASDHKVDFAQAADLIVNRSWRLAPSERVVIFWDASRDPGLAAPQRAAVEGAGGQVEEIAAPDSRADAGLTPAQKADRFERWKAVFQRSRAATLGAERSEEEIRSNSGLLYMGERRLACGLLPIHTHR